MQSVVRTNRRARKEWKDSYTVGVEELDAQHRGASRLDQQHRRFG